MAFALVATLFAVLAAGAVVGAAFLAFGRWP
jgi:hypothetical protein